MPPVYAIRSDLETLRVTNPDVEVPGDRAAQDALLEAAEIAVDLVLGPWPRYANGRKLDPSTLDVAQREALKRATLAACEHLLSVDRDVLLGADSYAPDGVQVVARTLFTSPQMLRELAGHGLVRKSGTVTTLPDPARGIEGWPPAA